MHTIVHFEIPANDMGRAKSFYTDLFDWKIESFPGGEYMLIQTDPDGQGIGGGIMKRQHSDQKIMNYISVPSVDDFSAKVEKLGGKLLMPKMAVPGMGYFAVCMDTEGNAFGLWETNESAK